MKHGKIYIHNVRHFTMSIKGIPIYVGRNSALGNPWKSNDRAKSITLFRQWFKRQLDLAGPAHRLFDTIEYLARREDVTLICWCHPEPCHANVIKKELLRRLRA